MMVFQMFTGIFIILLYSATIAKAIQCRQGYQVEALGIIELNEVSMKNCNESFGSNAVCLRVEAQLIYPMGVIEIPGDAVIVECRKRGNCTQTTCESYLPTVKNLVGSEVNVDLLEIQECKVGCCDTDKCNQDEIDYMVTISPLAPTTTTPTTTISETGSRAGSRETVSASTFTANNTKETSSLPVSSYEETTTCGSLEAKTKIFYFLIPSFFVSTYLFFK